MDDAEWERQWLSYIHRVRHDVPYKQSADYLRELIKTGLVKYADAHDNADRFFEAHRSLVSLDSPGFSM